MATQTTTMTTKLKTCERPMKPSTQKIHDLLESLATPFATNRASNGWKVDIKIQTLLSVLSPAEIAEGFEELMMADDWNFQFWLTTNGDADSDEPDQHGRPGVWDATFEDRGGELWWVGSINQGSCNPNVPEAAFKLRSDDILHFDAFPPRD